MTRAPKDPAAAPSAPLTASQERAARLAAALRDNLKRRKLGAASRSVPDDENRN